MTTEPEDRVALVDLDGTVADFTGSMKVQMDALRSPGEPEEYDPWDESATHIQARQRLIKQQPGFWRNLKRLDAGFEIVEDLRSFGFMLHVLTKAPRSSTNAWTEKAEWVRANLPDAFATVTEDKSLVYGRVLVDDFPPYFNAWLKKRPRGIVIAVAQPWNEGIDHPQVFRYDGTNRAQIREVLQAAFERKSGGCG